MQRFLRIYAAATMLVAIASSASASEDRYGNPAAEVLTPGKWWKTNDLLTSEDAANHMGEFVIVKGRVLSTFQTRQDLYLNFGENYKTDFTVRIPKRSWKFFGAMNDKEITVRGVLRDYNGPMIVIDFKEQIHEN